MPSNRSVLNGNCVRTNERAPFSQRQNVPIERHVHASAPIDKKHACMRQNDQLNETLMFSNHELLNLLRRPGMAAAATKQWRLTLHDKSRNCALRSVTPGVSSSLLVVDCLLRCLVTVSFVILWVLLRCLGLLRRLLGRLGSAACAGCHRTRPSLARQFRIPRWFHCARTHRATAR